MQRERRNQVEPRCAERWHLRDDEQFDLAAWFPSLIHSWSRVASFFSYLYVAFAVKLFLVSSFSSCDEVDEFYNLATYLHLIVGVDDEL